MASADPNIKSRKDEHLRLCAEGDVAFRAKTTLLEEVQLMHQCLPELALSEVDTSVEFLGQRLRAPLLIAAMTGGTDKAAKVNASLAQLAERFGIALGLGSQRAMLGERKTQAWTYEVRQYAPTALVLGNLGIVQARQMKTSDVLDVVKAIGADALCVHMNPAMEIVQREGDNDFRGGLETLARLTNELSIPVIAKETGSGIGRDAARAIYQAGVRVADVSGAGGTSWVGVETLRHKGADKTRGIGDLLWDWGIPTAASVSYVAEAGLAPIATGGVQHGLDVARALALGASIAGIARPVLVALEQGGIDKAAMFLESVIDELRAVMLLCGARDVAAMKNVPRVLGPNLRNWLS